MTWNEQTRILKADEGKWVTEDNINFAIEVKLAPSESVDNWWEVNELPTQPTEENVLRGTSEFDVNEYANTEPEE